MNTPLLDIQPVARTVLTASPMIPPFDYTCTVTTPTCTDDAVLVRAILEASPKLGSCSTHVRFAHGLHVGQGGKITEILFSAQVDAYNMRKGK